MTNDVPAWQERTERLIGPHGCTRLAAARVLIVGLGGVGGHAAEALARAGIGQLTLVDGDDVTASNCNRQLVALQTTVGQRKTAVIATRLHDINPACQLQISSTFVTAADVPALLQQRYDYVLDAIDSVDSKIALLVTAFAHGIPIASSMGAGGRLDPTRLHVSDVMDTQICPLARVVRHRLRHAGIDRGILAVWSDESPQPVPVTVPRGNIGSISYLPALFGLTLAGSVIQRLLSSTAATPPCRGV